MRKYPTDEQFDDDVTDELFDEDVTDEQFEDVTDEQFEEALRSCAAKGLLCDTGRRKWSERTQSYQIVWMRVPPKNERN